MKTATELASQIKVCGEIFKLLIECDKFDETKREEAFKTLASDTATLEDKETAYKMLDTLVARMKTNEEIYHKFNTRYLELEKEAKEYLAN